MSGVPYLKAGVVPTADVHAVRRAVRETLAAELARVLELDLPEASFRLEAFLKRLRCEAGAPDGLPLLAAADSWFLCAIFADSHEEMIHTLVKQGALVDPADGSDDGGPA